MRTVRGGLRTGRDAEPVRRVQPDDQVRTGCWREPGSSVLRLPRDRSPRPACSSRVAGGAAPRVRTRRRTSRTCSTCSVREQLERACCRSGSSPRPRSGSTRPGSACAPRRSPRAWTSASSRRGSGRRAFLDARVAPVPGPVRRPRRRRWSASTTACVAGFTVGSATRARGGARGAALRRRRRRGRPRRSRSGAAAELLRDEVALTSVTSTTGMPLPLGRAVSAQVRVDGAPADAIGAATGSSGAHRNRASPRVRLSRSTTATASWAWALPSDPRGSHPRTGRQRWTGMRRAPACSSRRRAATGVTRSRPVRTATPRPRTRRMTSISSSSSSAEEPYAAPSRRSSASCERSTPGIGRPQPLDPLADEQDRVGERQRVRDDEPRRDQHQPPPGQLVGESGRDDRDRPPHDQRERPHDPALVGEEQRAGTRARPDGQHRDREHDDRDARRHLQREPFLVAVGRALGAPPREFAPYAEDEGHGGHADGEPRRRRWSRATTTQSGPRP